MKTLITAALFIGAIALAPLANAGTYPEDSSYPADASYPTESSKFYDSGSYDELLDILDDDGFQTNN